MNPKIKTTVVGSCAVPSWLVGNTSRLVLRDAVMAVLKIQELAGLDLVISIWWSCRFFWMRREKRD